MSAHVQVHTEKSRKIMYVTDSARPGALPSRSCRRQAMLTLPAQEAHVSAARHLTSDLLRCWHVPENERDSAVLIVDELAANAARYGRERMTLLLVLDG